MSSEIQAKIKSHIVEAMKKRDQARLDTLRLFSAALKQKEIDERKELTDLEVIAILQKQLKQLEESLAQAKTAGRAESVAELEAQQGIIKEYLPKSLSPEELGEIVKQSVAALKAAGALPDGPKAMGAIMKEVREKAQGKDESSIRLEIKKEFTTANNAGFSKQSIIAVPESDHHVQTIERLKKLGFTRFIIIPR